MIKPTALEAPTAFAVFASFAAALAGHERRGGSASLAAALLQGTVDRAAKEPRAIRILFILSRLCFVEISNAWYSASVSAMSSSITSAM